MDHDPYHVLILALAALAAAVPTAAAPPSKEVVRLKHQAAFLRAKVKRLTTANQRLAARNEVLSSDNRTLDQRWNEALARQGSLERYILGIDPCPITRPNNSQPPGDTFGSGFQGNGQLWVGLGNGIVSWQRDPDGSVGTKFGWWREANGKLKIEGRRLDAPAPPVRASVPDGYGDAGFQATRIIFPTDGCWQATGSVGGASLTFVLLVIGAPPPS